MRSYCPLEILGICLVLAGCGGEEPPSEPIRPVRFQQVFATGTTRVRTFSGAARAAVQAPLSFRVGGTVRRLPVRVGAAVRSGQLIAELDAQDFELRVRQADAALRQAQAQATNADASYARTRLLYESNNASRSDLDAARSASESANAAVEAAANILALRNLELDYARLRAPFDGSVSAVHVEVNQNVGPGEPIVTEASDDRLEVLVSVPEVLIGQIDVGDKVAATFDALGPDILAGTVSEVGVTPARMATTFPVTVRLDRGTHEVRPGMAGEVAFTFEATDDRERFFIPSFAVGEDRDGRFVFLVEPIEEGLGVVRRCGVQVGELTSDGLEILRGLSDGDLVVTAGVSKISDGLLVRLSPMETDGAVPGGPHS